MSCDIALKKKGFKFTPQRRLIFDIIHEPGSYRTAEDIFKIAHARMPGMNKSTVYRTLDLLEILGCVYKNERNNKTVYCHTDEKYHQHLVCRVCGKTIECDECLLLPAQKLLEERYGFQANLEHLVVNGVCRECRKKM